MTHLIIILTPSPGAGLGSGVGALLGLTCLLCGVQVSPVHPVLGVVLGGVQVGVQAPPLLPVQEVETHQAPQKFTRVGT